MKKILYMAVMLAVVSACVPTNRTMLYKANTPIAKKQNDLDQCKIASFKQIPQTMVTEIDQGFYDPGYFNCFHDRHGYGYCRRVGGMYIPPSSRSYDKNDGLRDRFIEACLIKKGYRILTLPSCKTQDERQKALSAKKATDVMCNPDPRLDG